MTLETGSTGALIQGVSQQPEFQRLPGQAWEQINWSSSASDGLTRRGGTELLAKIPAVNPENAAIYHYERGDDEEYLVVIEQGGNLRVFDKDWVERTVSVTNPDYLNTGIVPSEEISFHTIADVTFIANRVKPIAESTTKSPGRNPEAIVHCKKGNYSRNYIVSVTWTKIDDTPVNTTITYTTRDSSDAAHEVDISADNIATELYTGLNAALTSAEGWTVTMKGSAIIIQRIGHGEFTIGGHDGNNEQDMIVLTKHVAKYTDLPNRCVDGYVIEVTGKSGDDFNNYWLKFNEDPESEEGKGKWKESLAPNLIEGVDPETMPHILLRKADGTFKFGPAVDGFDEDLPNMDGWIPRRCGDDASNPQRSFIGFGVNDIGTFQDRLVLLVDENVIMSRSRDYFNFYKETATTNNKADPIDLASSENLVSTLRRMVLFNKSLVVFSDNTQFVIDGSEAIDNDTVALPATSSFDSELLASPVPSGTNVFFPTAYGEFAGIREFFIEQQTDNTTATLNTQQVDRYLAGQVVKMAASTNLNILMCQTNADKQTVYVYEYYWQGNKKVQSSWSKWTFSNDVVGMYIYDTYALFFLKGIGHVFAVKMDLTRKDSSGTTFGVRLDAMQEVDVVDSLITVPITTYDSLGANLVVVGQVDTGFAGRRLQYDYVEGTNNQLRLLNDGVNGKVYVGYVFNSYYRMTIPAIKDENNHKLLNSRQQLMYLLMNVAESGQFDATVTVNNMTYTTYFEPFILGVTDLLDEEPPLQDDTFKVPVRSNISGCKIEFNCDTHLPVTITDIEWGINMRRKGRRL